MSERKLKTKEKKKRKKKFQAVNLKRNSVTSRDWSLPIRPFKSIDNKIPNRSYDFVVLLIPHYVEINTW